MCTTANDFKLKVVNFLNLKDRNELFTVNKEVMVKEGLAVRERK